MKAKELSTSRTRQFVWLGILLGLICVYIGALHWKAINPALGGKGCSLAFAVRKCESATIFSPLAVAVLILAAATRTKLSRYASPLFVGSLMGGLLFGFVLPVLV